MEEDGFKIVHNKKKAKKIQNLANIQDISLTWSPTVTIRKIYEAIARLSEDYEVKRFLRSLKGIINVNKNMASPGDSSNPSLLLEIVSYGIGSITRSRISQIQLGLLIILKNIFSSSVEVYDPIFTKDDHEVFEHFNCSIIKVNEEGKRVINNNSILFYMPHCYVSLYNNLLQTNWKSTSLSHCIIFGNTMSHMLNSSIANKEGAIYVSLAKQYCKEIVFPNLDWCNDVFNDTGVIYFSSIPFKLLDKL